jgi:hypothetical protein
VAPKGHLADVELCAGAAHDEKVRNGARYREGLEAESGGDVEKQKCGLRENETTTPLTTDSGTKGEMGEGDVQELKWELGRGAKPDVQSREGEERGAEG